MKILITGFPKSGKSTLARREFSKEYNHYCTDPQIMCDPRVIGIPDHLSWSEGSQFVCDEWLGVHNLIEGVAIPRALRKWKAQSPGMPPPCDKLIVLEGTFEKLLPGQQNMGVQLMKVLRELEWPELEAITEYRNLTKEI